MKRTKVTNKSDMAELEHKSFQDRLEQKGKTPNFIRKSRARAYVCVREEKEKMRFSNEKIVSEWSMVFRWLGNAHRFHELCVPTLTHVTNGGQFFRRLALFINVDTTNDFPPYLNYLCFHLSNRSSTNERWSFQPSPNFCAAFWCFFTSPFVFPDFAFDDENAHCLKITKNVSFEFWQFSSVFVLLELTYLVTLFGHKL